MPQTAWDIMSGGDGQTIISHGYYTDGVIDEYGWHALVPQMMSAGLVLNSTSSVGAGKSASPTASNEGILVTAILWKKDVHSSVSPFIWVGTSNDLSSCYGYQLGLSEDYPTKILLTKGNLMQSFANDGGTQILGTSTIDYTSSTYVQLLLRVYPAPYGDVEVVAYYNASPVLSTDMSALTGVAIPGIDIIIDDTFGINTGTEPFRGGYYCGLGFHNSGASAGGIATHYWAGASVFYSTPPA